VYIVFGYDSIHKDNTFEKTRQAFFIILLHKTASPGGMFRQGFAL